MSGYECRKFYLLGDDPSTAVEITFSPEHDDLKALRSRVGQALHVVQPQGITFHVEHQAAVDDISQLSGNSAHIGCLVDGHHVREVQGPQGLPIVGSFYEIFPDHLGNHQRLFRRYGSVIKTRNMGKTTYLTDSPEIAAQVFAESPYMTKYINPSHPLYGLKDNTALFIGDTETENWRLGHRFIPPALSPKAVKHYSPLMQESVRSSFKVFDELDNNNEAFNVYQYMLKLASQTIGKFAFGVDLKQLDRPESPLHDLVTNTASILALNKKVTARGQWYKDLPFGDPALLKETRRKLYGMIKQAIDDVKVGSDGDLELEAAAIKASCVVDYLSRAVDSRGEKLPMDLILANMVIVFGAGFTTTSSALSWMLYSLVNYEGAQERLLQELVDHGVDGTSDWDPEDLDDMHYLDNFVKETQRLHNPSFQPGRTTKMTCVMPEGYRIPADSVIIPAIYAIHANPKLWRDPSRFDPDRWDTEEVKKRHRCAYVPFATGPRGCIGFNFALQEIKILLSELVYRYEFIREGDEAVEYDPEFQLVRPLNLFIHAKRRTSWPQKSI
ncbi:cytochrome P450, partial [Aureobasidium melanogenum]